MDVEQLALLAGILFILIAVVGGGFTIKEVMIPKVPGWARISALVVGILFVFPFFWVRFVAAPSGPPEGEGAQLAMIYSDNQPDRGVHGIQLNKLEVWAEHRQPRVNDRISVSFTLQNVGPNSVSFQETFIAARNPGGENRDFGYGHERLTVEPNGTVLVKANMIVDAPGIWQVWPCYILSGGQEEDYCPTRWRAFPVRVVQ